MSKYESMATELLRDPVKLGNALGYPDLRYGLHDKWIRSIVHGEDDMTLQAHRGSYKTTCLCIGIALLMLKCPEKNIIFLRKTDADIVEVIKNVVRILESEVVRAVFYALTGKRLTVAKATASEITTGHYAAPRGASQLMGIGIGGSLTGKHADIVITDDIVNLRDRLSKADRDKTKAVYQELQNIRNPGGRIINTGTPWHKDDAFVLMPEPMRFDWRATRLLDDEQVERLRKTMSPSLFAANYELRHIAAENALFETQPETVQDISVLRDGIAHIDAAYGGEDYTALTCARRAGDTVYLYGRIWQRHVDTVLDAALADCARLMCAPVYCENNGDKGYLGKEMRARGASVRMYHENTNKYQKIAAYLRKWWGNIVFVAGTDPAYIAQIMDYTEDAEHDDAPDSAACVCRILDRSAGERINYIGF